MSNLEFKLTHISERLYLSIPPKAVSTDSSREALVRPIIPHEVIPYSKIRAAASRPQVKRAPWTPEEEKKVA
jgi:hypothetical protein